MPEGFTVKGHVLKLNKALERIKQGAHLWFKRNSEALTSVGFASSLAEPNLYIHQELPIMIAVFVDDIIVGYDKSALEATCRSKISMHNSSKLEALRSRRFTSLQGWRYSETEESGLLP